MFYAHAQKQTNKHNSLSLSLSFALSLAALPPPLFGQSHSPASNPDRTTVAYRFSLSSFFKTTQLFFFFFRYCISFFFCPAFLRHFLRRARVCLETHELFGHLVVGPLREYPHDGEAGFVH